MTPTVLLRVRYIALGLVLAAVAAAVLSPAVRESLAEAWRLGMTGDTDGLTGWFAGFGWWGPVAIVAFAVAQMFLVVFPSWLPMTVAVIGYGPFWGALIALGGVMLASWIGYIVGRAAGAGTMSRLLGPERCSKLTQLLDRYGVGAVMLFRVSPFLATDAVSFLAGAAGMSLRRYLWATFAGTLPLVGVIAYFGRDLTGLKTGMWWLGGIGLVAYVAFVVWRRWREGRGPGYEAAQGDRIELG